MDELILFLFLFLIWISGRELLIRQISKDLGPVWIEGEGRGVEESRVG